jgi:hypothetical protein
MENGWQVLVSLCDAVLKNVIVMTNMDIPVGHPASKTRIFKIFIPA